MNAMKASGQEEIFLAADNPAISEEAIRDAVEFMLDPVKSIINDPKRIIQMLVFLDYMEVETEVLSGLAKIHLRNRDIEPEFLIDLMFENQALYEKCFLPLEMKDRPFDPDKIQNQQARILFDMLKEGNCLQYLKSFHGNLVFDISRISKLTESQLKCITLCSNMFPKKIQIRFEIASLRTNEKITQFLEKTTNQVIISNPPWDYWVYGSGIGDTIKKLLDSKRVNLLYMDKNDPKIQCNLGPNVPKIEIIVSDRYAPNNKEYQQLLTTSAKEIVFNDVLKKSKGDLFYILLYAFDHVNIRHLKITSNDYLKHWDASWPAHENSKLKSLEIDSQHSKTAPELLKYIAGKTPKLKNLSVLCSENTIIDSKVFVDVLQSSPKLTHLYMRNVHCWGSNVSKLIDVLSNHPSLKTINGLDKESFVDHIKLREKDFRVKVETLFDQLPSYIAGLDKKGFIRSLKGEPFHKTNEWPLLETIVKSDPEINKALQGQVEPEKLQELVEKVFDRIIDNDPSIAKAYKEIGVEKLLWPFFSTKK